MLISLMRDVYFPESPSQATSIGRGTRSSRLRSRITLSRGSNLSVPICSRRSMFYLWLITEDRTAITQRAQQEFSEQSRRISMTVTASVFLLLHSDNAGEFCRQTLQ